VRYAKGIVYIHLAQRSQLLHKSRLICCLARVKAQVFHQAHLERGYMQVLQQ
jgi:hypothetical protein